MEKLNSNAKIEDFSMDFEVGLNPKATIYQSFAQKIENRCNFMNIRSANFDITFLSTNSSNAERYLKAYL